DAAQGTGREIWHSGDQQNDSFPQMTADVSFIFPRNDTIVFASEQDGWNHLYSIPATGGNPTLLTPGSFDVEDVSLSADQQSLYYSSNQNDADRRHIWRVALPNGKPQALTHGETIEWMPVEAGQATHCSAWVPAPQRRAWLTDSVQTEGKRLPLRRYRPIFLPHSWWFLSRRSLKARTAWRFTGNCLFRPDARSLGQHWYLCMAGQCVR